MFAPVFFCFLLLFCGACATIKKSEENGRNMMYLQNLHTHSTYCDGKNPLRDTIEKAIELGFRGIGFSGHSYMEWAEEHSMSRAGTEAYIREVRALQAEYRDRIDVFCGLELDLYSNVDLAPYDYVIGSMHYFDIDGKKIGFDRKPAEVQHVVDTYFGGDGMAYAKRYYETIAEYRNADILGHFDLVAKHCETIPLFDVNSKEYLQYAIAAIAALSGKIPMFEVNTGCISRGYRKAPYPTLPLIKAFREYGFGAVISSDCHNADFLNCAFDEACELLRAGGYKSAFELTPEGWREVAV